MDLKRAMEPSDACRTDHRLKMPMIDTRMQQKQRKTQKKLIKFHTCRLNQPGIKENSQKEIAEQIKDFQIDTADNTRNKVKDAKSSTCSTELG